MPRPVRADAWPAYQQRVGEHLQSLTDPIEVAEHERSRRRFLGEDPVDETGVRTVVEMWERRAKLVESEHERATPTQLLGDARRRLLGDS